MQTNIPPSRFPAAAGKDRISKLLKLIQRANLSVEELGALKQGIDEMSTEDPWWFDFVGGAVRRAVPGRKYLNEFGTVNAYDIASEKFLVRFEDTGDELKVDLAQLKMWTFSHGRRRRSPGAEEAPLVKNLMDRERTYNGSGKFLVPSADDMLQSCRRRTLRVLDLFAGSESVLEAISTLLAPKRGSQDGFRLYIVSLDIERQQEGKTFRGRHSTKYIQGDIRDWKAHLGQYESGFFDMIWCSPPCEKFSRANQVVTDEELKAAVKQVKHALACIEFYNPCVFYIENPDGRLRLEEVMGKFERYRHQVSYCHYGSGYRKNTDIWTNVMDVNLRTCCAATPCPWKDEGFCHHCWVAQSGDTEEAAGSRREVSYRPPQRLLEVLLAKGLRHVVFKRRIVRLETLKSH